MAARRYAGTPLLAIGIAFLAIGISVNRSFLAIGGIFIVIAFIRMRRS